MNLNQKSNALLITTYLHQDEVTINRNSAELTYLAEVCDLNVTEALLIRLRTINPATLLGKGKVNQIKVLIETQEIDYLVFYETLSSVQLRNLSQTLNVDVLDRNDLILKIFDARAQSKFGKLQVKLATLKYELPRLIGTTDYSGLVGGRTRGKGEQQLELDRRYLQREITKTEKQIAKQKEIYQTSRQRRKRHSIPQVVLVGYTNVGKSTILNCLQNTSNLKKQVYTADNIFASLDTSSRKVYLKNQSYCFVTDSVGFISNLPKPLLEAFYATLLEIEDADLIIHVLDSSSSDLEFQIETTKKILQDLKVNQKPILYILNKIDLISDDIVLPTINSNTLKISAIDKLCPELLKNAIYNSLKEINHF